MATTIYFSGSITGGREDVELYRQIVDALESDGHRVLAGSVAAADVGAEGEGHDRAAIFRRDLAWLDEADLVVAEVSKPSHGVGYEVAYARYARRIPVICLFRPAYTRRCSAMLGGDGAIELLEYAEPADLLPRLRESVRRAARSTGRLP